MINYYLDGPCGDCPLVKWNCDEGICIHWQAWKEVLDIIGEVSE